MTAPILMTIDSQTRKVKSVSDIVQFEYTSIHFLLKTRDCKLKRKNKNKSLKTNFFEFSRFHSRRSRFHKNEFCGGSSTIIWRTCFLHGTNKTSSIATTSLDLWCKKIFFGFALKCFKIQAFKVSHARNDLFGWKCRVQEIATNYTQFSEPPQGRSGRWKICDAHVIVEFDSKTSFRPSPHKSRLFIYF